MESGTQIDKGPSVLRRLKLHFSVTILCLLVVVSLFLNNREYGNNTFPHYARSEKFAVISENKNTSAVRTTEISWRRFLPADGNCLPNYFLQNESIIDKEKYRKAVIGFQHLNKAGGSTIRRCIYSLRTPDRIDYVISKPERFEAEAHVAFGTLSADDIDIYHGDYFFGMCEKLRKSKTHRSCTYFTLVRDPYERIISSYYFCKKRNYDQTCGPFFADTFTLEEWAVMQGSYFFHQLLQRPDYCKMGDPSENEFSKVLSDNLPRSGMFGFPHQCWFLQKIILDNTLGREDRKKLLDYLLSNLENIFAVIGLSSNMSETLSLLQEAYGIPFTECDGRQSNIGPMASNHEHYADLKEKLINIPEVNEALKEDVALYEKAVEIFRREMVKLRGVHLLNVW